MVVAVVCFAGVARCSDKHRLHYLPTSLTIYYICLIDINLNWFIFHESVVEAIFIK